MREIEEIHGIWLEFHRNRSQEGVYGAFGIHPLRAPEWDDELEAKLLAMMAMPKVVAWGECGLDYYDKKSRGQAA